MGLVQAIDIITSTIIVKEIIKDNGYTIDDSKTIIYGHSHGAYLSYLANALAPSLFSLLVDNSAWIYPQYLISNRYLFTTSYNIEFDYMAKQLNFDPDMLDLNFLYNNFNNQCNIISYHGTNDELVSLEEKYNFLKNIPFSKLNAIDKNCINNNIFNSTSHGLDADFLNLFDFSLNKVKHFKNLGSQKEDIFINTKNYKYKIDYKNLIPQISLYKKKK